MGSKSKRHHYLPVSYLRGFTDSSGKIHIYDKVKDDFYSGKPENFFVEGHRNTTVLGDEKVDFLEKLYAEIDAAGAQMLQKLKRLTFEGEFESELKMDILYFISFLRWRIPKMDKEADQLHKKYSPADLKYKIQTAGT